MGENYVGTGRNRLYYSCSNEARVDEVLVVDSSGNLVTAFLRQANISDDSIVGRHVSAFDELIFGFPIDGHFVADGAATMPGATLDSMKYTLTRDVNFGRLTVNTDVVVNTNGYRVFANYLQLNGSAIVHNDGSDGSPGGISGTASPGAGGAAAGAGSISYNTSEGKAGGTGGGPKAGRSGVAGRAITPAMGGAGGLGGHGSSGGGTGGTGEEGLQGSQNTVAAPVGSVLAYPNVIELTDGRLRRGVSGGSGGSGGGGGGAGTSPNKGGGGGGGGAAGGVCFVATGILDTTSGAWTGRISANGGNGGSGATGESAAGTGGRGAGGGGGFALLIVRRLRGNLATSTVLGETPSACLMARGGAMGAGGNATASAIASPGRAIFVNLSQPYVQPNEFGRPAILNARPIYSQRHPFRGRAAPFPPSSLDAAPPPILGARPVYPQRRSPGSRDVLKP